MNLLNVSAAVAALIIFSPAFGQLDRFNVREYHTDAFEGSFPANHLLPDPTGSNPVTIHPVVVFSKELDGEFETGDVLLVTCELMLRQQASGPTGSIKTGAGIYLGTASEYDDDEVINQYEITEKNGENQDSNDGLKDETYVKVGTYIFPEDIEEERKYVNVYAFARANSDIEVLEGRLSILRFTRADPPHAGRWANSFESSTVVVPGGTVDDQFVESSAAVVYQVDMDPNQNDPLQTGDIVIVAGEMQAKYTDSSPIFFHSQLRLSNTLSTTTSYSSSPTNDPPIGFENDFSMLASHREKKAAAKIAIYQIDAQHPGKRYAKMVAWATGLPSLAAVEIDPTTVGQGKLNVLRLRYVRTGDHPAAVTRFDQNASFDPMELICRVPLSDSSNPSTLFSHTLTNLSTGEMILALSELEATNQDAGLKTLGSQLIAVNTASPFNEFNISLGNNAQVAKTSSHHVISPKVAIRKIPSSISGTYDIKRVVWCSDGTGSGCSGGGFSGNCTDENGQPAGCCTDCTDCPGEQCDVINRRFGRLALLRFKPSSSAYDCAAECCADIVQDGEVDIDDLLAVINAWGACSPLPAACPADVIESRTVDIDDLLAVIHAWGHCPSPLEEGGGEGQGMGRGEGEGPPDVEALLQECYDNCIDDIECFSECVQDLRDQGLIP